MDPFLFGQESALTYNPEVTNYSRTPDKGAKPKDQVINRSEVQQQRREHRRCICPKQQKMGNCFTGGDEPGLICHIFLCFNTLTHSAPTHTPTTLGLVMNLLRRVAEWMVYCTAICTALSDEPWLGSQHYPISLDHDQLAIVQCAPPSFLLVLTSPRFSSLLTHTSKHATPHTQCTHTYSGWTGSHG
jgi:hypothetical protein